MGYADDIMRAGLAERRTFPDRIVMHPRVYIELRRDYMGDVRDDEPVPFHGTPVAVDSRVKTWAFQRRCRCDMLYQPIARLSGDLCIGRDNKCTECDGAGFVTYYEGGD